MRHHTVELNERELRAVLSALDYARDQTRNAEWRWWVETKYVARLYDRLLNTGLTVTA